MSLRPKYGLNDLGFIVLDNEFPDPSKLMNAVKEKTKPLNVEELNLDTLVGEQSPPKKKRYFRKKTAFIVDSKFQEY